MPSGSFQVILIFAAVETFVQAGLSFWRIVSGSFKCCPLEGCMRLGDEGADPGMDASAAAGDFPAFLQDGLAEFSDGSHIFLGFLRMADHKIQFEGFPAVAGRPNGPSPSGQHR